MTSSPPTSPSSSARAASSRPEGAPAPEFERRAAFAADGHVSVSAWLVDRLRIGAHTAASHVRLARTLERLPAAARALAEGEVSPAGVALLASAAEACPQRFAESEDLLLDAAKELRIGELRRALAYWREAADADRASEDEERLHERRRLFVSATLEGTVRIDGDLDPETGQVVITALRAVQDADVRRSDRSDRRTPAQRRADALGELCRHWLASEDRPTVAGERPHVVVTVDLDALERRAGRRHELEDVGPITAEGARRWACDAAVSRVITGGASRPLDVGRRTKVVPQPLRRALAVRDGGCAFVGCDRPPGWRDAHHVRHRADGGPTALDNLVLLCRAHHRAVHRGFGVSIVEGRPRFTRPDGTPIEDRAPP